MNQPVIIAENLRKEFGRVVALRGVSFQVEEGAFFTIFGRNGAGKSTLLSIISGMASATDGRIRVFGEDPGERTHRHRLSVISHESFLYDNLTALENLAFYGKLYQVENLNERMHAVLDQVGLHHRRFDLVHTFSRGMVQRLTIARAILHNPDLFLLDEPFTGLDQHATEMLIGLMDDLKSQGKTILLTTHDLQIGLRLSTSFMLLERQRVVETGTSDGLTAELLREKYFSLVKTSEAGQ
ncbi:MAG: ABC transporter ATP-binding protein [Lentisphaeria bacterium]|nr:ABC transporter ATP-binding protein [Candidatus Neomarinimicrobiota bacterium]MCF7841546.1 ABC transporter ATP-binding protein [Lentisphaeria bacterium]